MDKQIFWDEIQETIMIVGALAIWIGFEIMCFYNDAFAESNHAVVTRTSIITIVTNLFTFKFTKSLPSGGSGGNKKGQPENE